MPALCFTLDFDRDVNVPVPGSLSAGSLDRGQGSLPRFSSTVKGLEIFSDLFEEMGIAITFFSEARTLENAKDYLGCFSRHEIGCHGLDHEDFSLIDPMEGKRIIECASDLIFDISGTYPKSFRSPYMKRPDWVLSVLSELGYVHDSSVYMNVAECIPFEECDIISVPVPQKRSDSVTRSAYLWPVHEGKRTPEEFLNTFIDFPEDGILTICDHCWHIIESRKNGLFDDCTVKQNVDYVRTILEKLLDHGFKPLKISQVRPRTKL